MKVAALAVLAIFKAAIIAANEQYDVEFGRSVDTSSSPHRKRSQITHNRRSIKGQEDYDTYLGLAPGSGGRRQEDRQRRRTQDTSMSMQDTCQFCPGGLNDPDFVLPTDDGITCTQAKEFGSTLTSTDAVCDTLKSAESFCCPIIKCQSIVDIAVGNPDFSTLVAAVTAAGLVDALSGDGPLTVFAPTNDAFAALPEGTVESLLLTENIDTLTGILTYHVVAAEVPSTALENGDVETLNGASVTVNLDDGVKINDSNVITPDIQACNGIIHVIDAVLLPPEDPPAPEDGQCSCSPLEYNFILNFDADCETDDLEDNGGIGLTFCFLGAASLEPSRRLSSPNAKGLRSLEYQRTIAMEVEGEKNLSDEQAQRLLAEDIEIISIQFLEFDTSGELIVINQDDQYSNVTLNNGDTVTFKSIANDLDPSVPIGDQLDYLPGGVQVTLRGRVTDDVTNESRIVSNRLTWSYTNACDVEPLMSGESIGWITTGELTPASEAFCPAIVPPATTEAPPETTEAPPEPETTEAPIVTTEAPPIVTTEAPVDPPLLGGKSAKSKAGKQKKTDAKTHKTIKNPMAKVHKESAKTGSKDDGQDASLDADAKSGKALVDLDTKAEKAKPVNSKASSNSKGGKGLSMPFSKSGKSGTKTTKLFKEKEKSPKSSDRMSV